MKINHINIGKKDVNNITMGNDLPFILMAGPCQLENRDLAMKIAECLVKITEKLNIKYIFKASFDKANRNSVNSKRGIGMEKGMEIFDEIRNTFKIPVLTDVHETYQPEIVAQHVDMLQQPAFLVRQTDLSLAIAKTCVACNLKKGQFMAPWDMKNVAEKFEASGNTNICLTERGVSFGYGDLIVDPRSFIIMAETGYPVVVDATHSVMKPNAMGGVSGGESRLAPIIARAALSTGCVGGVFIETHPEPLNSGSDKFNMIPLMYMEETLKHLQEVDNISKQYQPRLEDWKQEGMPVDEILTKISK